MRKFEVVDKYKDDEAMTLPTRATKHSAGYDFCSAVDIEIPPLWKSIKYAFSYKNKELDNGTPFKTVLDKVISVLRPTLVGTGVKVKMEDDEYLALHNRSSNPLKKFLLLANGVGIIDADYYDNPSNGGEIKFAFWNFGVFNLVIKKGDVIGQGVFHKFLITDDDEPRGDTRYGGFGSTDTTQSADLNTCEMCKVTLDEEQPAQ